MNAAAWETPSAATCTPAHAELLLTRRRMMLASLERCIDAELYDVLHKKTEHEYGFLVRLIESDAREQELIRRKNKVLSTRYFVQIPLEYAEF